MLISRDLVSHLSPQAGCPLVVPISLYISTHVSNTISEMKEADDTEVLLQGTEAPRLRQQLAKR